MNSFFRKNILYFKSTEEGLYYKILLLINVFLFSLYIPANLLFTNYFSNILEYYLPITHVMIFIVFLLFLFIKELNISNTKILNIAIFGYTTILISTICAINYYEIILPYLIFVILALSIIGYLIFSNSISGYEYKTKTTKWLVFLIVFGLIIISLIKLYSTGIGTDEGNFLYVLHQISQNKHIYYDFWARESGSLLILYPWTSLFGISIISQRWLFLMLHLIYVLILYLIIRKISKINYIFSLISLIVLLNNSSLDFFQSPFYQINNFLFVLISYLSLQWINLKNVTYRKVFILGILSGLSVLNYKGAQVFLLAIPILLFYIKKQYLIKIYFLSYLTSILFYWLYFSINTDILHIYNVILEDIINNFFLISSAWLIFYYFIHYYSFYNKKRNYFLVINLLTIISFLIKLATDWKQLSFSIYSDLLLTYFFCFIIIILINCIVCENYQRYFFLFYAILLFLLLILGYGSRSFFTTIPEKIHYLVIIFVLWFVIFLLYQFFNKKIFKLNLNSFTKRFIILINIIFIIYGFWGGYLMPTRFSFIVIFLPILLHLYQLLRNKYGIFKHIDALVFSTLMFSIFINISLKNDFTLYSYSDFNKSISVIKDKLNKSDIVFSLDTGILSSIQNNNLISFSTPTQFKREQLNYYYDSIVNKYSKQDITIDKTRLIDILQEQRPQIIFGCWRSTMRLFEDEELKNFLELNYYKSYSINRIVIYERL